MEDWIYVIIVIGYLLYEVFSRVFNWRPEVKEPQEEDKQLDELFGEPEPEGVEPQQKQNQGPMQREGQQTKQPPPVPAKDKTTDQELMEALGLPPGMFQEKPQPTPQKKMPPVRPPAVPAQAQTTPQPNYWEQQLARQKEERRRQQDNRRERDLAKRFEQQAQKKKTPTQSAMVGDISNLHDLLRSPASARQAIVLREVLGPAPGLAPAGQPRETNTPFI